MPRRAVDLFKVERDSISEIAQGFVDRVVLAGDVDLTSEPRVCRAGDPGPGTCRLRSRLVPATLCLLVQGAVESPLCTRCSAREREALSPGR